jgi:hypothetical protein
VETELPISFVTPSPDARTVQIRVNFGMVAGREATLAEIDDLARAVLREVDQITIVAERRHVYADGTEAMLHQVAIELDELPNDPDRLVEIADRWARACFASRHLEVSEP